MRQSVLCILGLSALALSCSREVGSSRPHVINGSDVEAPGHFVSLFSSLDEAEPWCGGTYIGNGAILTAAHCAYLSSSRIYVAFGVSSMSDFGKAARHEVRAVRIHEKYDPTKIQNDLALLFVDPSEVPPTQEAATLADASNELKPGDLAYAIGYGNLSSFGWMSPAHLQGASIPVVDSPTCQAVFPEVGPTQLCAGTPTGGVDTCQGDSGGPLFNRLQGGQLVLSGIVSFGNGCAQAGSPGVYTRVSSFRRWIDETMSRESRRPEPADAGALSDTFASRCYDGLLDFSDATNEGGWRVVRHLVAAGPFSPLAGSAQSESQIAACDSGRGVTFGAELFQGQELLVAAGKESRGRFSAPARSLFEIDGSCPLGTGKEKDRWELSLSDNWDSVQLIRPDGALAGYTSEPLPESAAWKPWGSCSHRGVTLAVDVMASASAEEKPLYRLVVKGVSAELDGRAFVLRPSDSERMVEATLTTLSPKRTLLTLTNAGSDTIYGVQLRCNKSFGVMKPSGKVMKPKADAEGNFVHRFQGLNEPLATLAGKDSQVSYTLVWEGAVPTQRDPLVCELNGQEVFRLVPAARQ